MRNPDYQQKILVKISNRASFAYIRYWLHKSQSVVQFDRVHASFHERFIYFSDGLKEPDIRQPDAVRLWGHFGSAINQKIMGEIHFLFVSIDNTKDMMKVLLNEINSSELKKEMQSCLTMLDHYTHGRNTFEHFDERMPGGKKHDSIPEKLNEEIVLKINGKEVRFMQRSLGGLRKERYTFGDKEWDVSIPQFQKFIDCIEKFEKLIHEHVDKL